MNNATPVRTDRTVKARAAAVLVARTKALAAYADVTPSVLTLRSEGHSLRSIAGILNADGVLTRQGKPFSSITISRIIARTTSASWKGGSS